MKTKAQIEAKLKEAKEHPSMQPPRPNFLEDPSRTMQTIAHDNIAATLTWVLEDKVPKDLFTYMPYWDTKEDAKKEPADINIALFNLHINDAGRRAIVTFKDIYGEEKFAEIMQPIIEKGIMSIFSEEPNEHTKFFVEKVQEYVNERRLMKNE